MSASALPPAHGVLYGFIGSENSHQLHGLSARLDKLLKRDLEHVTSLLSASKGTSDLHDATLLTAAYLSIGDSHDFDGEQVEKLAKIVSTRVLSLKPSTDQHDLALLMEAAVACLSVLSSMCSVTLDKDTRLKLVTITDSRDPWTTSISATTASNLLSNQMADGALADFIAGPVLQETLRPVFAKPSSRITASGRPSQYAAAGGRSQQLPEAQPWKKEAPWAETVFRWAVDMSTSALIQEHWPLFTPVLLALVEDESIEVKSRGLEVLASFVGKCPGQVLLNTGIGRVFEDATLPMLLYLPSVTPEDQSTSILSPAYDVLINLAESYKDHQCLERRRLLDKLLREGIFAGHFHASQYTRIVQVLMRKTASLVDCLGIYSTKHLKSLLSMVSSVMTDPFVTSHPPTAIAATQALNAIITNSWPRIQEAEHTEQVIRILSLCWLNVSEETESSSSRIRKEDAKALAEELLHTSKILQALWAEGGSKRPTRLGDVLEQEPRLVKLFPPDSDQHSLATSCTTNPKAAA